MPRNDKGQFVPKEADKPAIFDSKFRNQVLTMEPGEINREKGKKGKKGKRISFKPDGRYKTNKTEEIEFLKEKVRNPKPFCKIKIVQKPEYNSNSKSKKN